MKVLLLVFVVGHAHALVSSIRYFGGVGSTAPLNVTALELTIAEKCTDAIGTDYMKDAVIKYDRCVKNCSSDKDYIAPMNPLKDYPDFCKYLKASLLGECVSNYWNALGPCFDKNEKYFPQFILNALNLGYEEFCRADGFSNTEYIFNLLPRKDDVLSWDVVYDSCVLNSTMHTFKKDTCIGKLNLFKDLDKGILNLSKSDVCRDLESFRKCSTQELKESCNQDLSRFVNLIYNPFLDQCNNLF